MPPTSNGSQHTTDSKHTTVGGDGVAVAREEKGACLGFADVVMVRIRVGKEFPDLRQNKVYQSGRCWRNSGQAQGRAECFCRIAANFYSLKTENSYRNGGIR